MAILTKEQAADLRERISTAARGLLDTDHGRAELLALRAEINALAEEASAQAQFGVLQLRRAVDRAADDIRPADQRDDDSDGGGFLIP